MLLYKRVLPTPVCLPRRSIRKVVPYAQTNPDNIPYIDKYKHSVNANETINKLFQSYHIQNDIDKDYLGEKIFHKWDRYHKVDIKDYRGELHLVVYKTYHTFKFFADANYEKITKRLNQLHVTDQLMDMFDHIDFTPLNI